MKNKLNRYVPAVFVTTLFAVMFFHFLTGQKVLLGTDAVISASNLTFSEVWARAHSVWSRTPLLGLPVSPGINFVSMLAGIMQNGVLWNNWYHGLGCLLASFFLMHCLRRSGVSVFAAMLAAVAAFWVGVNLTIIYAGHPGKPYIVMLFVAALIPALKAGRGGLLHSLLWGGCVGIMFAHQPDVALFFALFSGAYLLFRLWSAQGFKPLQWMKVLVPAAGMALLFAVGPLLDGYNAHVKDSVQTQVQTPEQKWDYVTQWSFPPEELMAFIAPGYTGWRSGEPDGPYWGRMGRSAGWEQTRQGFMNFKLESTYIGIIPIAFALFAVMSCRRSKYRAEVLFWSGSAVVALLLAFGKFFPLYSLFYHLPVVSNIRNPNKFLQVFQVALAILTAYGFDALFNQKSESPKVKSQKPKVKSLKSEDSVFCPLSSEPRRFFWFTAVVLGVLALSALSISMNRAGLISGFMVQGWPSNVAKVIVANQIKALWHAVFMAAVIAAVFAVFSFPTLGKNAEKFSKNWKYALAAAVILLVAGDALWLSRHYVKEMPRSYVAANALTGFLHENLKFERVALAQEQQVYGVLKMYTLPYNGIPVFNAGDLSRMPVDYQNFLQAMVRTPLALWEFSAVKYLLAPSAIESQIPSGRARKVFVYSVRPSGDGGFVVQPDINGSFAVFELQHALPHYALFAGSKKMTETAALRQIADLSQLSLPPDSTFPELPGKGICGSVHVEEYRSDRVTLSVESTSDAILRCADRYTPDWKAKLDGVSVAVEPVDYICPGVFVPAGTHTVEVYCDASKGFFYAQMGGYALFVLVMVLYFLAGRGVQAGVSKDT